MVVAGRGHEIYQEYKTKKYFSDKECIIENIKKKNKSLKKSWKSNVFEEILNRATEASF